MNEEFVVIKHSELTDDILDEIIKLKQQHWCYSYESQLEWINNFIEPEAVHLLLKLNDRYIGYLSIRNIGIIIDGKNIVGKGLGNVCVDARYRKFGYGKKIVEKANEIILSAGDVGILLCHTHLISFYEKCGWHKVKYDNLEIDKKVFTDVLMVFNYELKRVSDVLLDRNF